MKSKISANIKVTLTESSSPPMKINVLTLSFQNELEKLFQKDYFKSSLKLTRIFFLAGFLYYASFSFLDYLIIPEYLYELSIIRFAVVCPIILIGFILTYTKNFEKYWHFSLTFTVLIAGIGIILMTTIDNDLIRKSYYAGIILVLIYNYVMIKQRFIYASISGWILTISYILSTLFLQGPGRDTGIANIFFLTSANILGMIGSYALEFYSRKEFYYRHLLGKEKQKVVVANSELEEKINQKTEELQQDLKNRIRTEKELIIAKEKAEESDRLKTAFLANMSHEIRTPMNGILGFTELLNTPDLSSEVREEYIDIIGKSGHRMLDTINDLINISKIEAGLVDLSIHNVNLNRIATDLFYFFQAEAKKKGLKLSLNSKLPFEYENIKTDKEKINSIVSNLIKNALKYTLEGEIEFGFYISENKDKPKIEFSIKDTGIGIPESKQQSIFERFIQADIDQARAFEGSGLGLSITKSYIEMLSGDLWVESKEGVGSSFFFTIPIRTTEPIQQFQKLKLKKNDNALEWLKTRKVLVVEDDNVSSIYLENVLKNKCKKLLFAVNGVLAVEMVKEHPEIPLIFMDIRMPLMNGYEATKRIREFNEEVIIIAQTAYAMKNDIMEAISSGCDTCLTKPTKEASLLEAIELVLEERGNLNY